MFYMRYDTHIGEARSRLASMLRLGDHVSFSVRYVWALVLEKIIYQQQRAFQNVLILSIYLVIPKTTNFYLKLKLQICLSASQTHPKWNEFNDCSVFFSGVFILVLPSRASCPWEFPSPGSIINSAFPLPPQSESSRGFSRPGLICPVRGMAISLPLPSPMACGCRGGEERGLLDGLQSSAHLKPVWCARTLFTSPAFLQPLFSLGPLRPCAKIQPSVTTCLSLCNAS